MISWTEFERRQPALAHAGRGYLYEPGVGLGHLATVRLDGGPRVHPVCVIASPAGLHMLIIDGPKLRDLRRDGRYALHSESCPPPREDDGFAVTGRVREIADPQVRPVVRRQLLDERDGVLWPDFDSQALFELLIERCLLTVTRDGGPFPKGATVWKAT
jgi:hypothetical protein